MGKCLFEGRCRQPGSASQRPRKKIFSDAKATDAGRSSATALAGRLISESQMRSQELVSAMGRRLTTGLVEWCRSGRAEATFRTSAQTAEGI